MRGDGVENFGQAVDLQGGAVFPGEKFDEVVGQKQDVLDVVQMGMADENVFDAGLCGQVEGGGHASGVEQNGVVDQKSGQVVAWEIRSRTAEHAHDHVSLLVAWAAGCATLCPRGGFVKRGLDRVEGLV